MSSFYMQSEDAALVTTLFLQTLPLASEKCGEFLGDIYPMCSEIIKKFSTEATSNSFLTLQEFLKSEANDAFFDGKTLDLLDLFFSTLERDMETKDETRDQIKETAQIFLEVLLEACDKNKAQETIIKYHSNILAKDWKKRESALLAIAILFKYGSDTLYDLAVKSIPTYLSILSKTDETVVVRDAVLYLITRMIFSFPKMKSQDNLLDKILSVLVDLLKKSTDEKFIATLLDCLIKFNYASLEDNDVVISNPIIYQKIMICFEIAFQICLDRCKDANKFTAPTIVQCVVFLSKMTPVFLEKDKKMIIGCWDLLTKCFEDDLKKMSDISLQVNIITQIASEFLLAGSDPKDLNPILYNLISQEIFATEKIDQATFLAFSSLATFFGNNPEHWNKLLPVACDQIASGQKSFTHVINLYFEKAYKGPDGVKDAEFLLGQLIKAFKSPVVPQSSSGNAIGIFKTALNIMATNFAQEFFIEFVKLLDGESIRICHDQKDLAEIEKFYLTHLYESLAIIDILKGSKLELTPFVEFCGNLIARHHELVYGEKDMAMVWEIQVISALNQLVGEKMIQSGFGEENLKVVAKILHISFESQDPRVVMMANQIKNLK